MLPKKIAFVDIETTGSSPTTDRAIEIGIVRVDGENVQEYSTLLDPGMSVSPFIQELTGIDARELDGAPSFYEVKDEIAELLDGALFVAHNARFDYGFLKYEFKRYNMPFSPKQLCTVKLSRKLFPNFARHNLSAIIDRYNFECEARHRALGDAKVLWDFYRYILSEKEEGKISEAISELIRRPTLPPRLAKRYLDTLVESPGVYTFYDKGEIPLYIGKSVNVKERVLSHFSSDITSASRLEMVNSIEHIDIIPTAGDLSAQLLESEMIKEFQPLFNRQLRLARKLVVLKKKVTNDGYFSCEAEEVERIDALVIDDILGVFRTKKQVKDFLSEIVKEYSLCQKYLGIEKTEKECFACQLGWCRGACVGREKALSYNMRFTQAFAGRKIKSWPFAGPVTISESHGGISTTFLIDRWCVVKKLKVKSEKLKVEGEFFDDLSNSDFENLYFDFDAYKILSRYMLTHHNLVKPLKIEKSVSGYQI